MIKKVNFQPAVKWSGSKRSQVWEILKYFPSEINTYWEPFCGGCSVLMGLLLTPSEDIKVNKFICRDFNQDLINLWNLIKEDPIGLSNHYCKLWSELNGQPDREAMKQYFYKIRERLNEEHKPEDFLFILRTTTNGMPRYNKNGEFNNSFHVTRNGIEPDRLRKILCFWSDRLNKNNVQFEWGDYRDILGRVESDDFVYLDPPYANTKGMYHGTIPQESLFCFLEEIHCPYVMSYDGIAGKENNIQTIPEHLFDEHILINSGNSSFRRTIGKSRDTQVYESLYIKH